ncbi:type I phosphomannose isomerase catalytic subunit [Anaeromicrobium sediminis]|uniref:type I phosphomannose isomerase catalytic subunit n=1 Tax=Anaeromicrobium sediminis TaxID=1478221 RepID=UPI001594F49C|nr:type I phosphomannose isomerase catalytic subunit [Anaeromicrobium sediminis]
MYPLKFYPLYKEKVWGGSNIQRYFQRNISEKLPIGESWELCCHEHGTSLIKNGKYKNISITDLINSKGHDILGENHEEYAKSFPLLIKYIDANDKLSVQVHPNDEYTNYRVGESGKIEMWYIVDAMENANIIYGLKEDCSKDEFIESVMNNSIKDNLNYVDIKAGDVLYIPAGTVHAICEGTLIAEIQQNSDTTYRLYDWDRVGLDGKPRQLHITDAVSVIDHGVKNNKAQGYTFSNKDYDKTVYVSCDKFTVEKINVKRKYVDNLNGKIFKIYMCLDGDLDIIHNNKIEFLKAGETILIPASLENYRIIGNGTLIKTYIQEPMEVAKRLNSMGATREDLLKIEGLNRII